MRSLARGTLVVSCQAGPGNPLDSPASMALMAQAAEAGGAGAIRANGPDDVAAYAVVGHAITDPMDITSRLVNAIPTRW